MLNEYMSGGEWGMSVAFRYSKDGYSLEFSEF